MPLSIQEKVGKLFSGLAGAYMLENEEDMMGLFRNYLIGRIVIYSPAQLGYAIQNDLDLWFALPPRLKNLVHNLGSTKVGREAFEKYYSKMTTQQILKWLLEPWVPSSARKDGKRIQPKYMEDDESDLAEKRNSLGQVIFNWPESKGIRWLDRNRQILGDRFKEAMGIPQPIQNSL